MSSVSPTCLSLEWNGNEQRIDGHTHKHRFLWLVLPTTTDAALVEMWVSGKRRQATRQQYRQTWSQFSQAVGMPLPSINFQTLRLGRQHQQIRQSTQKDRVSPA